MMKAPGETRGADRAPPSSLSRQTTCYLEKGGAIALLLIAALAAPLLAADDDPPFKKDDLIIFAGDSLTEKGTQLDGFVTLVGESLRRKFPPLSLRVQGAGVGWDRLNNLRQRYERDVLSRRPHAIVILIGGNDVEVEGAEREAVRSIFEMGMEDLAWRGKRIGARVLLSTLTVLGENIGRSNKVDRLLDDYSEIIRKVAASKGCELIELHKPMVEYLKTHNTNNVYSGVLTVDGGHLNETGNRLVADIMLKALLKAPPAEAAKPASPRPSPLNGEGTLPGTAPAREEGEKRGGGT